MNRREFKAMAVRMGIGKVEEIPGLDKPGRARRWLRELVEVQERKGSGGRRFVNRFKVGGDPEFYFSVNGAPSEAQGLGMYPGYAFGSDQTGRQAELRLAPSRSVVKVCASALNTLRCMNEALGAVTRHEVGWYSAPVVYFERTGRADGVGGHVHFGRQSNRERVREEISGLDGMLAGLARIGVWNPAACVERQKKTHYGMFGDVRKQSYGWEYRAFPSWIESPWLMFFVLTLAKLVVREPEAVAWGYRISERQAVENLLGKYQGLDEDAWLAKWGLKVLGWPKWVGGDFRKFWGIQEHRIRGGWIPEIIPGTPGQERELVEWFTMGKQLQDAPGVREWSPLELPEDFTYAATFGNVFRVNGMGDLLKGFVVRVTSPLRVSIDGDRYVCVGDGFKARAKEIHRAFAKAGIPMVWREGNACLWVGQRIRENPAQVRALREILKTNLFPIYEAGKAEEQEREYMEAWQGKERAGRKKNRYWGMREVES